MGQLDSNFYQFIFCAYIYLPSTHHKYPGIFCAYIYLPSTHHKYPGIYTTAERVNTWFHAMDNTISIAAILLADKPRWFEILGVF